MRLIIIGGVAAGSKAAAKARRQAPQLDIIIYQDEAELSYSACGMPYVIGGIIENPRSLIVRSANEFAKDGIQVFTHHRVLHIDTSHKQLTVKNLQTDSEETVSFDCLLLATGARPIMPKVEGIDLRGVVTLRNYSDLERLQTLLNTTQAKQAVIIGAGYIGLELAEAFQQRAIQTTLLEKSPHILPKFDAEIAALVHHYLVDKQVNLIVGDGLVKLHGARGRVCAVESESGKHIAADLVVLAIGIRPNTELAKDSGIALGVTGAIKVTTKMETNIEGIFAAGDCCETLDRITGKPIWMPLGDMANLQGRVAGENAAGGDAHFLGTFGTAIFKSFDLQVGCTGLSETAARANGFDAVSVTVSGMNKARYYPDSQSLTLKLIADKHNGRVLGAQAVGFGGVDKMIDIVATALLGNLRCADLENADLAYSPPFSPVLSPVIVAAGALKNKLTVGANLFAPCG